MYGGLLSHPIHDIVKEIYHSHDGLLTVIEVIMDRPLQSWSGVLFISRCARADSSSVFIFSTLFCASLEFDCSLASFRI